jgi:hypothetical protein
MGVRPGFPCKRSKNVNFATLLVVGVVATTMLRAALGRAGILLMLWGTVVPWRRRRVARGMEERTTGVALDLFGDIGEF